MRSSISSSSRWRLSCSTHRKKTPKTCAATLPFEVSRRPAMTSSAIPLSWRLTSTSSHPGFDLPALEAALRRCSALAGLCAKQKVCDAPTIRSQGIPSGLVPAHLAISPLPPIVRLLFLLVLLDTCHPKLLRHASPSSPMLAYYVYTRKP